MRTDRSTLDRRTVRIGECHSLSGCLACTWRTTLSSYGEPAIGIATLNMTAERERGLDFSEDLFNPFVLRLICAFAEEASVIASTDQRDVAQVPDTGGRRSLAVANLVASPIEDSFARSLVAASDQYLVSRGRRENGHRRLPLVWRLGSRHHDRSARPHTTDRQI